MKSRLIKREFERFLFDRRILFVLFLMLVLNAFAVFADEGSSEYRKNYKKINSELSELEAGDRISFLEERIDSENRKLVNGGDAGYHYSVIQVLKELIVEISDTADYDGYVQGVIDNADLLENVYSDDEGYSGKNLEKTQKDYGRLFGLDVSFTGSRGFSKAVSFRFSMLLFLIYSVYMGAYFVCRDKETNMSLLLDSTSNGGRLLFVRLFVCFATGFFLALLIYLENLFIYQRMYGGNVMAIINKPLQNLQGFTASSFKGSILEYLFLNLVLLALLHLFVVALFSSVYFLTKNRLLSYLLILLILGAEYFSFVKTDSFSARFGFKCYNIFSVLFFNESVRKYVLVSVFSKPVEWRIVIIPVLATCTLAVLLLCYAASRSRFKGVVITIPSLHFPKRQSGLVLKEARKLFIDCMLVPVLFAGILFSLEYGKKQKDIVYTVEDAYYRSYVREFTGKLDSERLKEIEAEKQNITELREKYSGSELYSDRLRDVESREIALMRVENDCNYLKTRKDSWLVYNKGYECLFYSRTNEIILMCIALVMTCLVSAFYWEMEHHSNVVSILTASGTGWKKIRGIKCMMLGVMSAFISLAVYLPEFYEISGNYKIGTLSFPAYSLKSLESAPSFMSFGLFLAIVMIARFAVLYVYAVLMEKIVVRFKSVMASVVVGLMAAAPVPIAIMFVFSQI